MSEPFTFGTDDWKRMTLCRFCGGSGAHVRVVPNLHFPRCFACRGSGTVPPPKEGKAP